MPHAGHATERDSDVFDAIAPLLVPFVVGPTHPRPQPPAGVRCWALRIITTARGAIAAWVVGHPAVGQIAACAGIDTARLDRCVAMNAALLFPGAIILSCVPFEVDGRSTAGATAPLLPPLDVTDRVRT